MQTQNESNELQALTERHVQLLEALAPVQRNVRGIAVTSWLAGKYQKFGGLRSIRLHDRYRNPVARPIGLSLEAMSDGSLSFSGAISRPRNGRMRYDVIFRYDLTRPMVEHALGATLPTNNVVLARRALGLLEKLLRYGELSRRHPRRARTEVFRHPQLMIPFAPGCEQVDEEKLLALTEGMRPDLVQAYAERLRADLIDRTSQPSVVLVNAAIAPDTAIMAAVDRKVALEDYTPVLGVPTDNPVVPLTNPAAQLLEKHDISNVAALPQEKVDALVAEFRAAAFLGDKLTLEEVYDALLNPEAAALGESGFGDTPESVIVQAMRKAARNRVAQEATHEDLIRAARYPRQPLVLSRLAVTQVVAVEDIQLPDPYVGYFLPPLDWEPPRKAARYAA
jgi:hypothetical protein